MWLIADSGSTKTEWVLFNSQEQKAILTPGFNPLFLNESKFIAQLKESIPNDWVEEVTKLWFYGAGCGSDKVKESTSQWLKSVFINADIEVESDLLAAARATCGKEKGIVAILGTGSNSCYYDGEKIENQIKPLGFILGDEGSGVSLGKSLLKRLLRNQLSPKLSKVIYEELEMDYDEIINQVYKSESPNRFIASCSSVLQTHKDNPEIEIIISNVFNRFTRLLASYKMSYSVNFIGSIAFYYKDFLEKALEKRNLKMGKVLKTPSEELVRYHLEFD